MSSNIPHQVLCLLLSLKEANIHSVFQELCQFIEHGAEGSVPVLQTCLDLYLHRTDLQNLPLESVLVSIFRLLMEKPNFSTVLCQSLRSTEINDEFLQNLFNVLHLSLPEKIGIGLALSDSDIIETRMCAKKFCIAQIEELCANPVSVNSKVQIQSIIMFLQRFEGLAKHVDHLLQILFLLQPKESSSSVLTPLRSDEKHEANFFRNVDQCHECKENEMEEETSAGDIVKELGYGCTFDALHCKEILSQFLPLSESTISKILGTIARSHASIEDSQSTFSNFGVAIESSISAYLPLIGSWDIGILVKTIKQLAPGTNWIQVMENMDHEGFYIPNEEAFSFFMSVYRHACQDPFPLHAICGSPWKNTHGQLSILKYAVLAPPEVFTFAHSGKLLVYHGAVHGHKLQLGHANHAWLCLDLFDVLCQLAEMGHSSSIQSMLEYPLKHCPEILLIGISHISTAKNLLQHEVSLMVFPMIIKSGTGSGMIHYIWHVNPSLVVRGFVDAHSIEPDCMTMILDICQELRILSSVLDMIPCPFGIRLAALASRKELDLEKWLTTNLITYKDFFFEECLKFLKEVQLGGSHDFSTKSFRHTSSMTNIYTETSSTFLKVLRAHTNLIISSKLSEEMERLNLTIMDSNPQLQNGGSAYSSIPDGFSDDVKAEANTYFLQMFSSQLTIDSMIQMLSQFKESPVRREQLIFECMIGNLFEEYRFFPEYPERQLKISAVLFGSVIKHQLVTHPTLGIALRAVLDALREPPDSKMFVFGTQALEQFVDRLIEWPQYCNHILQISHLRDNHSELVSFIERELARNSSGHLESDGSNSDSADHHRGLSQASSGNVEQLSSRLHIQQGHNSPLDNHHKIFMASTNDTKSLLSAGGQSLVAPLGDNSSIQKNVRGTTAMSSSQGATSARFDSALNIQTLVAAAERRETQIEAPASDIQDNVSIMINSISAANIEATAKNFTELLKEQYYPWFSQYMVMKRASIEPNFHNLYLKFLDKVNSKALNKEIVHATYENCKVLLGSELIKSSSEERSLLKNLGSWLGKLTIGRNRFLWSRGIDPQSLLIEAYEKGLMIAVIPFTLKILEPCQSSIAYQPPNPWTMSILGLLAEIHSMPNLKMNLKFDIEVLFKNLGVDLKEITPTSHLKDRKREIEGNPDFFNKDAGQSQPLVAEVNSGILCDIVQHSASIATQTTKELVLKDYAIESDETQIQNAAHLMAAKLAGSLAHALCKELLHSSISTQLRNSLHDLSSANEHLEQAVPLTTNDNLDLGCAIIEQAATDKAMRTIDGEIDQQLSLRRKHHSVGPTFFDANMYTQGSILPEALRPTPGHLSVSQQPVYEDFLQLPRQNQSCQSSHSIPTGSSSSSGAILLASALGSGSGQLNVSYLSAPGNLELEAVSWTLDKASDAIESNSAAVLGGQPIHTEETDGIISQKCENNSFSASFRSTAPAPELQSVKSSDTMKELASQQIFLSSVADRLWSGRSEPTITTTVALDKYQLVAQKLEALVNNDAREAEFQRVIPEVPEIILRCISRDEAALAVAQKVFKGLYENASNNFHVNACLAILASICDVCKLVLKELTSWVICSDEEQKFNKDITVGLIYTELLNLAEYNVHMAKLIDGGRNKGATEFAISLIQALAVEDHKVISELHNIVDELAKLATKPGSPESLQQLIEMVRNPVG